MIWDKNLPSLSLRSLNFKISKSLSESLKDPGDGFSSSNILGFQAWPGTTLEAEAQGPCCKVRMSPAYQEELRCDDLWVSPRSGGLEITPPGALRNNQNAWVSARDLGLFPPVCGTSSDRG